MIKQLFIPQSVGNYFICTTYILGFDIRKTSVRATLIRAKKRELIVQKNFDVALASETLSYTEQVADALKVIMAQCPPIDIITSCLPSSQAIFKELRVPFIGRGTIKKIIGYEVEPLLPFPLQEAVVDCIVIREIPEEKSSEVLVAAVQNHFIASHLALFEAAGIQPEKVTLDFFALYGLYQCIPHYSDHQQTVALLEIEADGLRLAYIYQGKLRFIRSLSKGLLDLAHLLAQKAQITDQEALEHIIRFGLEDTTNTATASAFKHVFTLFFNEALFTLQSFTTQAKPATTIHSLILVGTCATIKGLPDLLTDITHMPTELFSVASLIHNGFGVSARVAIPQVNIISFATAFPRSTTAAFNLRQQEFALSQTGLFIKQLITACALLLFIFGTLGGTLFWHITQLKHTVYQAEQEALLSLKEHIKKLPKDTDTLEQAISSAKNIIAKEEKTWSAFSSTARTNFLEYLAELTKLNKDELGLEIEKLTMTPDVIIMKAQVKGYEELTMLEKDLKESKFFSYVEPINEPKFSMTLRVAKKLKRER